MSRRLSNGNLYLNTSTNGTLSTIIKKPKRRNERNILTFYEKIAVIRYYNETNVSRNSLAKMFHCCTTQIRRILERKQELLQQLATLSEADTSIIIEEMTRKRRKFEMSAISFILHQWVQRCRQLQLRKTITNDTLKEIALKMAAILNLPTFRPSYRWLNRFRTKYKYNDEDLGVGLNNKNAIDGELSVEDIIIEFKDALPSFMQKEISTITQQTVKTSNDHNITVNSDVNTIELTGIMNGNVNAVTSTILISDNNLDNFHLSKSNNKSKINNKYNEKKEQKQIDGAKIMEPLYYEKPILVKVSPITTNAIDNSKNGKTQQSEQTEQTEQSEEEEEEINDDNKLKRVENREAKATIESRTNVSTFTTTITTTTQTMKTSEFEKLQQPSLHMPPSLPLTPPSPQTPLTPPTSQLNNIQQNVQMMNGSTTALFDIVFPHLAIVHQFALLNSDIHALELITKLGVHMQMQAANDAYKQLSLAFSNNNNNNNHYNYNYYCYSNSNNRNNSHTPPSSDTITKYCRNETEVTTETEGDTDADINDALSVNSVGGDGGDGADADTIYPDIDDIVLLE